MKRLIGFASLCAVVIGCAAEAPEPAGPTGWVPPPDEREMQVLGEEPVRPLSEEAPHLFPNDGK